MIINSLSSLTNVYTAAKPLASFQKLTLTSAPESGDKVSISDAAKAAASAEIQKQLDAIKAKPAVERTADETTFLQKNDTKLAEIAAKDEKSRTAEDIDYMQKAGGFVNTMAYLSPKEKALYNEMVANGNSAAVEGMNLIAFSRAGSGNQPVTLANGKTFNPSVTEITADNALNLFKQMFVDNSGKTDSSFDALAAYLDQHKSEQVASK